MVAAVIVVVMMVVLVMLVMAVFISWGCLTKCQPQTVWLKTPEMYCLRVLETRNPK